ncbi:hypothetical protein SanaruYs_27750 [Chryseotalea sanaruensis]|uniref:Uncharacterized protein n=1 Tax=Chryseotalea sanaruensis TaxID=2482724 RepID=A0A401UCB4_9BACT|nr:T9SS type A sorting domain-containing protein [Chryseotalea sanaruensis]GCC52538.1 hypothetical protein SanaruYs_27750 [Chryseotalea sanaruensis]
MRVLTIVLFTLVLHKVFAQNGPGGVASRNGSSDLLLWLSSSDFAADGYQTGDAINSWTDLSGRVANTFISNSPQFTPNVINGFPAVEFESNDEEFMEGMLDGTPTAPLTIIAVANFRLDPQPDGTGQYVFGLGGGGNNQASISRQDFNDAVPHAYYSFEGPFTIPTRSVGPSLSANQWYAIAAGYNTIAPYHQLYINNASQVIVNDFDALPTWDNANYSIGRNSSGLLTSYLDGDIAEIIVIDRLLNDAERNILFNYFSAKYNLSISNDLYMFDDNAQGNFDLEVVGIGVEVSGSQSVATSAGLNITINTGFENGDYLLWGHRTNLNSVNDFDITEISEILDARWSRTWGVDVTNTGADLTVDLSFDFEEAGIGGTPLSASNYYLIRSLGAGMGWEIIATANSISGDVVNFINLAITDGVYTLATEDIVNNLLSNVNISTGNGPAGIGSTSGIDLALWLDASQLVGFNNGDPIAIWPDLTSNTHDATQATGANQPVYIANALNAHGVARFNGANSFMAGSLGASFNAPFTLFAVARFGQVNQGADNNDYVFDLGSPGPGTLGTKASISRRRNNDAILRTNRYYSFQGDIPQYGPVINGGLANVHAFAAVYQLRSPYHQLYYNGALSFSAPGNTAIISNGVYHLGRLNNTSDVNYFLDGDIAEVIVYNSVLNSTQIRIIQSYLASKWGFNLSGSDLYTGDDVVNGNNDLDIGGAGRGLDGDVGVSISAGMTVRLGTDAVAESFIMFGHNIATNSANSTDVNGTIEERSDRAWYFTLTGNIGITDSITFDFSEMGLSGTPGDPNNYVLIYRSGTSGDWSIVATASDTDGDQVYFTEVDLTTTGNGFYTLASINNAPLPVSLLSFDAKVVTEGKKNLVLLKWQTASELNNDYFTLERSMDGKKWLSMLTIPGKGSFNGLSSYESLDQNPPAGKVYYRLKQTDLDGQSKYVGGIKMVTIEYEEMDVNIFPNPSTGFVNVLSKRGILDSAELIVTDFTGKEMFTKSLSNEYQEQVQLTLTPGLYLISLKKNNHLLYSQRLMISE